MKLQSVQDLTEIKLGDIIYLRVRVEEVHPPIGEIYTGCVQVTDTPCTIKPKHLGDVLRLVPEIALESVGRSLAIVINKGDLSGFTPEILEKAELDECPELLDLVETVEAKS